MTLQPVADDRNAWSALMLDAMPPDRAAIAEVFDRFGLSAALGPLPCILRVPDLAALSDDLPASQIMLCLPVALCGDPAQAPALQALRQKGFRLMAEGVPAADATLAAGVESLALDCPGREVPAELTTWLQQLPGPHMGIGVAETRCPGSCRFQWRAGHATETVQQGAPHKSVDAPNRLLLLELLSKVANDADSHDIETTIKRDPQLSYYLLKLVNSVGFALTTKITSFNQAITLLGRRQLQRWLQLLLYARTRDGDKANALLPRAAQRAGLTEALCKSCGGSHDLQDRAFMVGMFSLLDQLFGMPIEEVVQPLNLAEDVQAALIRRTGPLGVLLDAVTAGEVMGAPAELSARLAAAGIGNEDWARCQVSACHWAVQVSCEA
jgi:EAL and modified HD-GYP domain-containing signal transduction protein